MEASRGSDCNDLLGPCGQCDFSALLLRRLVEGHVLISNIYFAASLDPRLRYQGPRGGWRCGTLTLAPLRKRESRRASAYRCGFARLEFRW